MVNRETVIYAPRTINLRPVERVSVIVVGQCCDDGLFRWRNAADAKVAAIENINMTGTMLDMRSK